MRDVLLLSCYELGHQPLGLAVPLGFLKRAGHRARGIDLAVEPLDEEAVRAADFVGVSVPMHTALRLALPLAARLRELNPRAHLCFYGLYATLNADLLLASGADSVLSGECEEEIVRRVESAGSSSSPPPVLARLDFPVPERSSLTPLSSYAHLERPGNEPAAVGSVETTRGCLHLCRHCPIPPVYGGRFFVVPRETVLEDVRQLVARGARHIDFVDADFLNGPGHALAVARAMHEEHPQLTFDFTAKIEHLLKHRELLGELAELGCLFVVSAVESLSDVVLRELDKGHDREDVVEALRVVREAGLTLRPTFVAFTPWTTREDYRELLDWVLDEGLVEHVDPVQLTLRLLIPPGSLLLENESLTPHLGALDPERLTYRWRHPDPEMDRLQLEARELVEKRVAAMRPSGEIFAELSTLATGRPVGVPPAALEPPPRLTEAWFC